MHNKGHKLFDVRDSVVLVSILLLLIVQLPHLGLPFFWDEAWSYMVAIKKMAEAGPGLFPGVVPIEYCKGHPQFYYFISACWLTLFPDKILYMRLFPLLVSVALLIVFYFGLKKISNGVTAGMGVILLAGQSMFLAQSIMVLPEMMLSLWLLLALFAFIRSDYKKYALWGALMVLTKETALVFVVVFVGCYLVWTSGKSKKEYFSWKNFLLIVAPLLTYFIFLCMHKFAFGVFFYQEHLGYISFEWEAIWKKLGSSFVTVFVHYGRLSVLLLGIGFAILLLTKKIRIANRKVLICVGLLTLAYFFFLCLNFYSPRYTLSLLVFNILIFALLIDATPFHTYIKWTLTVVASAICLFYSFESKRETDIDLGYVEVIQVNQEIVSYCETNGLYDQAIAASFNMNFSLKDKVSGYLSGERIFTDVQGLDHYMNARYVIFETTTKYSPVIDFVKSNFILKKSFRNKHAYGFVYENPSFSLSQGTPP